MHIVYLGALLDNAITSSGSSSVYLVIDNSNISEISVASTISGGLVSLHGSSPSSITISRTKVSHVSALSGRTMGGIVFVVLAKYILISRCAFEDIVGCQVGGVLYVTGCTSIDVEASNFTSLTVC
jgi:hypothetical protein